MKRFTVSEVNELLRRKNLEDKRKQATQAILEHAVYEKGMQFSMLDAEQLLDMWDETYN